MEIILKEDVENLGEAGDVVDVADGYARNYLFPKMLAVEATEHKKEEIERRKEKQSQREEQRRERAQEKVEKLEEEKLVFTVKAGEEGKLFGSVTSNDIVEKLEENNYDNIVSADIKLDENIRSLGLHRVPVKVYAEIKATVKVEVIEAEDE